MTLEKKVEALMLQWHLRLERERENGMPYTSNHYSELLEELEDATGIRIQERSDRRSHAAWREADYDRRERASTPAPADTARDAGVQGADDSVAEEVSGGDGA